MRRPEVDTCGDTVKSAREWSRVKTIPKEVMAIRSANQGLIGRCLAKQLLLVSLLIAFCFGGFAQDATPAANFLLGVIFKLEVMHDSAVGDIRRLDSEIHKTDGTIEKAEKVIRLAREQGNSEAERVAQSALATAKDARSKNLVLKASLESTLRQIDLALAAAKNKLASTLGRSERIEAMVSNFTGRVSVQKKDEQPFEIDPSRPVFLEIGDVVATYDKSSVELQFLEGRGTLKLGEYSRIEITENTGGGIQALTLVQGNIDVKVEKTETFERALEETIEKYRLDLQTTKDEVKQRIVDEFNATKASVKKKITKKFEVRTPAGAMSVRGTRFIVRLDGPERTEVIVFEGSVEIRPLRSSSSLVVEAGYRIIFSPDGILSGPDKINVSGLR